MGQPNNWHKNLALSSSESSEVESYTYLGTITMFWHGLFYLKKWTAIIDQFSEISNTVDCVKAS